MTPTSPKDFAAQAQNFTRSPLSVISLFIVMIYAIAALVIGLGGSLTEPQRTVLVWFLALFPAAVFAVFSWLVVRHHLKLYGPSDFSGDGDVERWIEATAALSRAEADRSGAGGPAAAERLARTMKSAARRPLRGRRVLWVDDRPHGNAAEARTLRALGMEVETARSTEAALAQLKEVGADLVISDMGRPESPRAGYDLLAAMRDSGDETPFIIYTSEASEAQRRDARSRGAQANTNRPVELIEEVLAAFRALD
ncbi:response regulator [Rhodovulum sp. DZ06]|uniref:response regulator n=1 Tax=Rhodovulum sp. DZ06 TaxID=3425126 RepID=UPI003D357674